MNNKSQKWTNFYHLKRQHTVKRLRIALCDFPVLHLLRRQKCSSTIQCYILTINNHYAATQCTPSTQNTYLTKHRRTATAGRSLPSVKMYKNKNTCGFIVASLSLVVSFVFVYFNLHKLNVHII